MVGLGVLFLFMGRGQTNFFPLYLKKFPKVVRLSHTAGNQEEAYDWLASSPGYSIGSQKLPQVPWPADILLLGSKVSKETRSNCKIKRKEGKHFIQVELSYYDIQTFLIPNFMDIYFLDSVSNLGTQHRLIKHIVAKEGSKMPFHSFLSAFILDQVDERKLESEQVIT